MQTDACVMGPCWAHCSALVGPRWAHRVGKGVALWGLQGATQPPLPPFLRWARGAARRRSSGCHAAHRSQAFVRPAGGVFARSGHSQQRRGSTGAGDLRVKVEEVAGSCARLVDAWNEMCRGLAEVPTKSSPAGRDAHQFRESQPDGPRNVEYAPGHIAGQYVETIGQLVLAMGALARADRGAVAPWPLIRSGLELAGRVAWLLEDDLGDTAGERRVARFYLELISSRQRDRYTSNKTGDRLQEKRAKSARDAKVVEARSVFVQVDVDFSTMQKIETWVIGGEKFKSVGSASALFLERCFTRGSGLYDFLSDYSHPSLTAIERQTTRVDADGVSRIPWTVGTDVIEEQARLLCSEFNEAAHLVAWYYALDATPLERWASSVPSSWFADTVE